MSDEELRSLRREVKRLRYELSSTIQLLPYLRFMVEGSQDGLALIDDDGKLLEWNRSFTLLVGLSSAELRTASLRTLFHDPAKSTSLFREGSLRESHRSGVALHGRGPNGELLELLLNEVQPAGAPTGPQLWALSVRHLTEETLQARALQEARANVDRLTQELDVQRRFAVLFEHSPDALLLVAEKGEVLQRNARAAALWPRLAPRSDLRVLEQEGEVALLALVQGGVTEAHSVECEVSSPGGVRDLSVSVVPVELLTSRGVLVTARDVTRRKASERALQQTLDETRTALAEREVLLKETHHRVKNNLQVISSLLSMQAERSPTETVRQELQDTMSRVRAMGLVHQMLYGGFDLVHVDLHGYLEAIVWELRAVFDRDADISVDASPVAFTLEQAVPFGLMVNELLTNACKHGRSADGKVRVRLKLRTDEHGVALEVTDGGPGFPLGRDPRDEGGSLGMTLLHALTRQLDATLTFAPGPGAKVTLQIPPRVERPRHAPSR